MAINYTEGTGNKGEVGELPSMSKMRLIAQSSL